MKAIRVVYAHGNNTEHWSSGWAKWLQEQLDLLGIKNVFQTFPDSLLARKKYWLPFIKDELKADEHTIMVGWSSGATAILRYTEHNKILGSVLVAPSYTDLGLESEKISEYYDEPWNWEAIRKNQKHIVMLYSKNDQFIPYKDLEYIREHLQPDNALVFEDKGHFINQETFPELLEEIKNIMHVK